MFVVPAGHARGRRSLRDVATMGDIGGTRIRRLGNHAEIIYGDVRVPRRRT